MIDKYMVDVKSILQLAIDNYQHYREQAETAVRSYDALLDAFAQETDSEELRKRLDLRVASLPALLKQYEFCTDELLRLVDSANDLRCLTEVDAAANEIITFLDNDFEAGITGLNKQVIALDDRYTRQTGQKGVVDCRIEGNEFEEELCSRLDAREREGQRAIEAYIN